jgi:hypothetical protein
MDNSYRVVNRERWLRKVARVARSRRCVAICCVAGEEQTDDSRVSQSTERGVNLAVRKLSVLVPEFAIRQCNEEEKQVRV